MPACCKLRTRDHEADKAPKCAHGAVGVDDSVGRARERHADIAGIGDFPAADHLRFVHCGWHGLQSGSNVNTNQYAPDQVWQVGGAGGSLATFIVQIAGLANQSSFGIYDASNPNTRVMLFNGAGGLTMGDQALVSILADGSVRRNFADTGIDFAGNAFGYYLTAGSTTLFSQVSLNGGHDQMVAFRGDGDSIRIGQYATGPWGANEFVLAWEDILGQGSDRDFNDFVAIVESVSGVSEPNTLALLCLGLLTLGALKRRPE